MKKYLLKKHILLCSYKLYVKTILLKKPSFSGLFSDAPSFPNSISQEQTCSFALAPVVSVGHLKSDTKVNI